MKKIDLHGIKHADVIRTLDSFLWEMMCKGVCSVEVITGISDSMKKIVRKTCRDYNFIVDDHPTNVGCLIIRII